MLLKGTVKGNPTATHQMQLLVTLAFLVDCDTQDFLHSSLVFLLDFTWFGHPAKSISLLHETSAWLVFASQNRSRVPPNNN